ncbi:MAG: hypothetical protein A2Y96_03120 [Firmicutes bacterium RBG_13_65_8]|nr:MAG: hypothetical protein A2Y96_03120 [Firmicutes bacterium RBG_13_65_8]
MRHERLAGGLAVLLIGVMFLLANAGLLDLSVWTLVGRFWPVILVLAGLILLVGLGFRWFVVLLLAVVIVAGAFGGPWLSSLPEGRLTTKVFVPEPGTGEVTVLVGDLSLDAPKLQVLPPTGELYRLELRYRNTVEPRQEFSAGSDGRGLLTLDQRRQGTAAGFRQILNMSFRQDLELDLRARVGAVNGSLDFSAYKLRRLAIDGGALQLDLTLGTTPGRCSVEINAGVGNFTISVPRAVGLRVSADLGVGIKQFSSAGLRAAGGAWADDLYGTAESTVDIRVTGGVGRISISRY